LFADEPELSGFARELDQKSGGLIRNIIADRDFEGKPSQTVVVYTRGLLPAARIALVGLGKRKELNLDKLRSAYASVVKYLRDMNIQEAATSVSAEWLPEKRSQVIRAVAEGVLLGLYRYTPYKTVDRENFKEMKEFKLMTTDGDFAMTDSAVKQAQIIAEAVYLARDLASAPSNAMTPSVMAQKAREMARRRKISCRVLGREMMRKMGMNALLAVASGSHQEPQFIILEYRGTSGKGKPIVLVGKGLTFDSGGISIKPAEKMDEMKMDMSGGAAVMAAVMAAADLKLPLHVVGFIPATENLPGGGAYKPGDIIRSYSGKTIEVLNTDAEGRLILADALAYAVRLNPAAVVDVATLTGACVVALGDEVIGMLGTDDGLKNEIRAAADETGERVWELPLWENYHEQIKSDIADYKNTGGRFAGAITAAAFLSKFVGENPWVHLDIAGPAWTSKEKPCIPKGASGIPVRLLVEFLRSRAEKDS